VLKVVFWGLVALDVAGVGLLFLLGLAAAGSTKGNPAQVALLLFVLPCIPLLIAIVLFVKTSSPGLRILALLIAATPLIILVGGRAIAQMQLAANVNDEGEMTYFRSGPKRELAEAIRRNDTTAVARLVKSVDVNDTGLAGMTFLLIALRQLEDTPDQQTSIRLLLEAGAKPNKSAQYEYPLTVALEHDATAGPAPVQMLLDAGADPNQVDSFGNPVFFMATGKDATVESLKLLLDRGANINAVAKNGHTILFDAANTRNWAMVLYLLERGADPNLGKAVNGMPFKYWVDGSSGLDGSDSAYVAVRRYLGLQ
jgi:hypothetical protein